MIAIIGLGNIGFAIARRVHERNRLVCGVDLAEGRRASWSSTTGLVAAASLDDVPWSEVEATFVVVRLTDQAASVLDALRGLPLADQAPVFVVTTLELEFARDLEWRVGGGFRLVESPVSGGEQGAARGALTVMAAGPLTGADERLLLDTVAARVVRFPRYGEPTLAKLLNNVAAAYNASALAEILFLGDRLGVDAGTLRDVLLTSSGGSWITGAFEVLVDDLLDKDVALLRRHVGSLPEISLGADADLQGRLAGARALLSPPVTSAPGTSASGEEGSR